MNESRQDHAIEFVLGMLSEAETAAVVQEMQRDPELQTFVRETGDGLGSLVLASRPVTPPETLLPRILARLERSGTKIIAPISEESAKEVDATNSAAWLPWAVAACLAVTSTVLGLSQVKMQHQLASLQNRDELAQMHIATLTAQVDTYSKVAAVVVWDVRQKHGLADLTQLPALDQEHDYQLWVIDPTQKAPVSGGIVTVNAEGSARLVFSPTLAVASASQFAISIERKGGETAPAGQIILAGK